MKVALVVFPLHYSHGCILQTFALYSKLKELGCEVTIYDRQPDKENIIIGGKKVVKRIAKRLLRRYRGPIFFNGYYPKAIMQEQQHFIDRFRKDVVTIYSTNELSESVEEGKFDAIVVGSDQTWRPRNVPNVMDYWLEFAKELKLRKVAYAPSFGVDIWEYSEEQTVECSDLARRFNGLSVREESGVKLCRDHLKVAALHVLDPTMLWTKAFYIPFAEEKPLKEGGVNCYFLDKDENKNVIASTIARKLGLSITQINTKTEDSNAPVKERMAPSIEKWLAGFHYGDFIVVDSFHAMVFSILFEKSFIVIGNKRRGLARFESLLGELGIMERLITEDDNDYLKIAMKPISWDDVRRRLDMRRCICCGFLREGLSLNL